MVQGISWIDALTLEGAREAITRHDALLQQSMDIMDMVEVDHHSMVLCALDIHIRSLTDKRAA
jgi:hypothetical protein